MTTETTHTLTEGQRVHWLANLGGLVAIAGLEDIDPAILVGALTEINVRLRQVSKERLEDLKTKGLEILQARNSEKRTFKSWQRANETARFDFSREQQQQLIIRLGGKVPVLEKDIVSELRRLLKGLIA